MTDYDHLGTSGSHIEILDYDPRWPLMYEREAERIRHACGDAIATIEHIGSTAVPGLPAKPILDIMPGVATHADGAHTIEPLTGLGYEYKGENGIPGRYYFDLRYEQRVVVHVHLFEVNTENWLRHLLFRDYLRVHADIAGQYASLKRDLALRYRHERAAYTDAKSEFINDVVVLARAERQMPSPGDVIALC